MSLLSPKPTRDPRAQPGATIAIRHQRRMYEIVGQVTQGTNAGLVEAINAANDATVYLPLSLIVKAELVRAAPVPPDMLPEAA